MPYQSPLNFPLTISNKDRAGWAATALNQYGIAKEGRPDYDLPEDMAADLICDLMHLIRAHDADPQFKLKIAILDFEGEEDEQEEKDQNLF